MIARTTACLMVLIALTSVATAQNLDSRPYRPGVDANIDLYLCDWRDSMPQRTHGSLIERPIFIKGDPLDPPSKGAVLIYMNRFSYATLAGGSQTTPVTLDGEQEVLYIVSGSGSIKAAGKPAADLYPGIGVLVPSGLEFTMKAAQDSPLEMYLVSEPIPAGFRPNSELLISDENVREVSISAHWAHIWRGLFGTADGLGTIESIGTVTFDPMTIGHPHSHEEGVEEFWTAVSGTSTAFIGKQIRTQVPGMAYLIPPDAQTPHSNINTDPERQIKLLYIARYRDHEVRE